MPEGLGSQHHPIRIMLKSRFILHDHQAANLSTVHMADARLCVSDTPTSEANEQGMTWRKEKDRSRAIEVRNDKVKEQRNACLEWTMPSLDRT